MNKDEQYKIERLLIEALGNNNEPDKELNEKIKHEIMNVCSKKNSFSLWWLPALSGTIISLAYTILISLLVSSSFIVTVFVIFGALSTVFTWILTVIGIKKLELVKEACI